METKPKIMVTGANGQLGKELKRFASQYSQFDFIFLAKEDMPIHHFEMVRHYFNTYQPQYLINCAAYTAVDRAESERERAFQINGEAVGVLAAICKENDCHFIHISTDYVFDGTASVPYTEDAATNPQTVYGTSKLEGEKQAVQFNPNTIIIRTSWLYSEYGKNFVKTILKMMKEKEEISVVNDQTGSPTYAADLAEVILQIISSGKWHPGIYHYANEGAISWYEFALAIKEITCSNCKINPIPTSLYSTTAHRPAYSVLDTHKIRQVFGAGLKGWRQSLALCINRT